MPTPRSRRGVVENAGGGVICPTCRSHEAWITGITTRTDVLTVMFDRIQGTVAIKEGGWIGTLVELDMTCTKGHTWGLTVEAKQGDVRVRTEWTVAENGDAGECVRLAVSR